MPRGTPERRAVVQNHPHRNLRKERPMRLLVTESLFERG